MVRSGKHIVVVPYYAKYFQLKLQFIDTLETFLLNFENAKMPFLSFSVYGVVTLRRADDHAQDIASLPNEILIKIFTYIPTSDLLQNVSRVSKNFNGLSKVTLAHQNVTLLDNADKVSEFLTANKSIVSLNLIPQNKDQTDHENLSEDLLRGLMLQNRLSHLNLDTKMSVNEKSLISLLTGPRSQHLTKLRIHNYHNLNEEENITNWKSYASNLKLLDLRCSFTASKNEARSFNASSLIEIGETSRKLEYFRFEGFITNEEHLGPLFTANQNTLKEVHLPFIKCSNNDVQCLSKCEQLESLSICLDGFDCSKETFFKISENKQLKSLTLKIDGLEGNIRTKDVAKLLEHSNLSKLTSLELSSADMSLATTEVFKAISSLQYLTRLHLSQSHPETFETLLEFLGMANKKLERLFWNVEIEFNQEDFGKIFLKELPALKYLKIATYGSWSNGNILHCLKQQSGNIIAVRLGPFLYYNRELSRWNNWVSSARSCNAEEMSTEFPEIEEELERIGAFSQTNIFDPYNAYLPHQSLSREVCFSDCIIWDDVVCI